MKRLALAGVCARRGGHIPGALSVEWNRDLRPDGTFRPPVGLQTYHRAAHTGNHPDLPMAR